MNIHTALAFVVISFLAAIIAAKYIDSNERIAKYEIDNIYVCEGE